MINAISSTGQLPPISFGTDTGSGTGAPAPATSAPAGKAPAPQAPALQPTVIQALDVEQAAAAKAAEVASKAQAAVIDKAISQQSPEPSFRPSRVQIQRDLETGRVAVEIFDALTGEKTGQVPSEQLMKTMSNISKQIGLLLDKNG